jgi:NADPH:quinone reductase-like Zn-dependent oxidoreductase
MYPGRRAVPIPAIDELLIRVVAVGTNPADWKWRAGWFANEAPLKFPHVIGYDIAGLVGAGGGAGAEYAPGDRVVAKIGWRQGAYAEWATVPVQAAAKLPDGVDFATAATLPTAGLTGIQMVEEQLDVRPGQRVLITGATGAVGRCAMHAAKMRGAEIVAAVRESQRAVANTLGANTILTLGVEHWSGGAFDRVANTVGGPAVADLCRHVAPGGIIGTVSTTPVPDEHLRLPVVFFNVRSDGAQLARLAAAVAAGDLSIPIAHRLSLDDAVTAHRLLEAGGVGGKIVMHP